MWNKRREKLAGSVIKRMLVFFFVVVILDVEAKQREVFISLCGKEDDNFLRFYGFDMKLIDITIIEWL